MISIQNEADWLLGESVFMLLTTDKEGFAKAHGVSKEYPAKNQDFLKAKVNYVSDNGANKLSIDYPFDR